MHPFREGNTRTQFAFFRQLSAEAGYTLDTERFTATRKPDMRNNSLVGDLREQFVWGRFEYMQTGDTRLMREVLDMAIADASDPLPVGPISTRALEHAMSTAHDIDLRRLVGDRLTGAGPTCYANC